MKRSGIYSITSPSGKRYIGSAVDIARRWRAHKLMLRKGAHHNIGLNRAAVKYGVDGLIFAIIEECAADQLLIREQWYLDNTDRQFNRYLTAGSPGNGPRGPHSAGTREKIGAAQRGKKLPPEQVLKMVESRKLGGYTPSAEHREKISAANKGKTRSKETRALISNYQRTKTNSETTKERIAVARNGRKTAMNKSGYCGVVYLKKRGKWQTMIKHRGTQRYIGCYATPELAYAMRLVYLAALPPGGV